MSGALLQTKLHVPRARPGLVTRVKLIASLNEGLAGKLTLVSGPAGYGKTTLVAGWILESGRLQFAHHAWLSLDEDDNDLPRFLAYLIAALQQIDGAIGRQTLSMLSVPQRPHLEPLLVALLNDLAVQSEKTLLVVDDYHTIHAPEIHEALTFFLDHQPSSLHIVLITREDPPLPLARWRARGQMTEMRQADLRFSVRETAAFLNGAMGLDLTPEQIAALDARTEGWVAGLHLAALAMQGRQDIDQFVKSFTGSNRFILDYLVEEVFRQQPAFVRRFLLVTSILDRLSAPLCDTLLKGDGWNSEVDRVPIASIPESSSPSQSILAYLERSNLFTTPLDDERRWYRYHHLFSDLLHHQLRKEGLATTRLHQLAGSWYAENGFLGSAITHFLSARNWDAAATLLSEHSETLLKRGEVRTLLRWMEALPEVVVSSMPRLCLSFAWALIFNGQFDAATAYLHRAACHDAEDVIVQQGIASARAYIARMKLDLPATITLSERALDLTPPGDHASRGVLVLGLAIAYWQSGQTAEATQAFIAASHEAQQGNNQHVHIMADTFLSMVRAAQGQLHQAGDMLRDVLDHAQTYPPGAAAHYILSALLYEWSELDGAAVHVEQAIDKARRSGNAELIDGAYRQLARLKQATGNASGALAALEEAERAVGEEVSKLTRSRIADAYVQLMLAQGDVDRALHWFGQRVVACDASFFYPLLDLTPARLALAQGNKLAAAQHLARQYDRAVAASWEYGAIETRALQALAAPDAEQALPFLRDALLRASPEGYVRTFVDKGPHMAALLRYAAAQGIAADFVRTLLGAFNSTRAPATTPSPLIEPLSERELELLQLLARRRTNAEISTALTISINTVKTHLGHIYDKLGVHDRRAAVTRARELGQLP